MSAVCINKNVEMYLYPSVVLGDHDPL